MVIWLRLALAILLVGVGPALGRGTAVAQPAPARIGVLPSIEMIIWVAVGGRGTLIGPIVGAFGVNWLQSLLTTHYPDLWILVLGGLFVSVVLFFPDGVVGTAQKLMARFGMTTGTPAPAPPVASPHPAAMAEGKREEVAP